MAVNATCFDPQHQPGPEGAGRYEACWSDTSDGHSVCCPQGWTCLKNLLCLSTGADSGKFPQGTLQRGLCTDETFESSNCPQFCLDSADHPNNGTLIKNCGDGTGCCRGAENCSCTVGSPDALLLGAQKVVPYSVRPSTVIVLLQSGTVISTPTPPTVTTTISSVSISTTIAANPHSDGSTTSTATSASLSNTTNSSDQSGVSKSSTTADQLQVSSSPASATSSPVPKPSAQTPNLGLAVGLPVVAVVVIASIVLAFFIIRRRSRKRQLRRQGAERAARLQPLHDQSFSRSRTWDYQTVTTPTKSRSKPRNYYDDKPLPTPRISIYENASPLPDTMHELPNDDWMPRELPAALPKEEFKRHEIG